MWRFGIIGMAALLLAGCTSAKSNGQGSASTAPQAPSYVFSWDVPESPAPPPAAAAGAGAAAAPAAAAPAPPPVIASLDDLWAKQDWDGVIRLLLSERESSQPALEPPVIKEKLYAAYINKGHRALKAGDINLAREAFLAAITVDPSRVEAEDGFQAIGQEHQNQMDAAQQQQQQQAAPPAPPAPAQGAAPKP